MHLSRLVPTAVLAVAPFAGLHAQALSPYEPYVFNSKGSKQVAVNVLAAASDGGLGRLEVGRYSPPSLPDFSGVTHRSSDLGAPSVSAQEHAMAWFADATPAAASVPNLPGSDQRGMAGRGGDDFASQFARAAGLSTPAAAALPAVASVRRNNDGVNGLALGHQLGGNSDLFAASIAQAEAHANGAGFDRSASGEHGIFVGELPQAAFHSPAFFDCSDDETPAECVTGFKSNGTLGSVTGTSGSGSGDNPFADATSSGSGSTGNNGTVTSVGLTPPASNDGLQAAAVVTAAPEPSTISLVATGAVGLIGLTTRRKRNRKA